MKNCHFFILDRRAKPVAGYSRYYPFVKVMMAATTGLEGFVSRMRNCFATDERSDAELVRLYAEYRSDEAFAELVKRYAPMVWGVCRRRLGNYQLAEDAFQAVFMVFVRKAASIRPPAAVGGWLHTVAVHTSIRTRIMAERRRHSPLSEATEKAADNSNEPVDSDLLRVLDDEIARLPDKLRTVVALCELGGLNRHDAAARLGIAEGTLSSRLAAARKQLAARFRTRGIALSAASLSVLIAPLRSEAVPSVLTNANGTITAIADGVIRTMFISQFKLLSTVTLTLLAFVIGGIPFLAPASANDPRPARRNAPVPKVVGEGVICFSMSTFQKDSRLIFIKPDGTIVKEIELKDQYLAFSPKVNSDGTRVAVFTAGEDTRQIGKIKTFACGHICIYDLKQPEKPLLDLPNMYSPNVVWGSDPDTLYISEVDPNSDGEPEAPGKPYPWITSKVTVNNGKKTALDLPLGHTVLGIFPDNKTIFTRYNFSSKDKTFLNTPFRVPFSTLKPEQIDNDVDVVPVALSHDARRYLSVSKKTPRNETDKIEVFNVNLLTLTKSPVKMNQDTVNISFLNWSPNGKKLVMIRIVKNPDAPPLNPGAPRLPAPPGNVPISQYKNDIVICNTDGSDQKVIYTPKEGQLINGLDWR